MAERSKAADCKSAGLCPTKVRILLSPPASRIALRLSRFAINAIRDQRLANRELSGSNSVGRVTAFQAVGRGFESRLPLQIRWPLSVGRSPNPLGQRSTAIGERIALVAQR